MLNIHPPWNHCFCRFILLIFCERKPLKFSTFHNTSLCLFLFFNIHCYALLFIQRHDLELIPYSNSSSVFTLHSNIVSFQISLQASKLKEFLFRFNQYGCISSLNFLLSLTSLAFFNLKCIATAAFHRLLDIIFHTILDFLTKDCYLKQVSQLKIAIKFILRHFC